MGEAYFYHLTRSALEDTLRILLLKSLDAGWRVALRGRSAALLDRLDARLWLDPGAATQDGFLPHGRAGGPHDALQPILLTTGAAGNDPACLVSVEGAEIDPREVAALARVMVVFDGGDPAALERARAQWRALKEAGIKAKYWSEDSGRWEMKAET